MFFLSRGCLGSSFQDALLCFAPVWPATSPFWAVFLTFVKQKLDDPLSSRCSCSDFCLKPQQRKQVLTELSIPHNSTIFFGSSLEKQENHSKSYIGSGMILAVILAVTAALRSFVRMILRPLRLGEETDPKRKRTESGVFVVLGFVFFFCRKKEGDFSP